MATARQQRPSRNRRQLSPYAPPLTSTPVPEIVSLSGLALQLQFRQYPTPAVTSGSTVPVQLTGIPAIVRAIDGTLPTGATLTPDQLFITLTYGGANLQPTESFRSTPSDPGIRTNTGGFIAATTFGEQGGLINVNTFTASAAGPNSVDITWSSIGLPQTMEPLAFTHVESGTTPTTNTVTSPLSATLLFVAAITPGDHITYSGAQIFASPVTAVTFDATPQPVA